MTFDISIFVNRWPDATTRVARTAEDLGYRRLWFSEHHTAFQTGSPVVCMAVAASCTHTLAVGSAGLILQHYDSLRVAEDAHTLETLFPGRIDIGLVRGRVGTATDPTWKAGFANRFREVCSHVRGEYADVGGRPTFLRAVTGKPRIWLCSLSDDAAELAAAAQAGFIFYLQLAGREAIQRAVEATRRYREAWSQAGYSDLSRVGIICTGHCAADDLTAEMDMPRVVSGIPESRGSAGEWSRSRAGDTFFIGSAATCWRTIHRIQHAIAADEVILHNVGYSVDSELDGYRRLADVFRHRTDAL